MLVMSIRVRTLSSDLTLAHAPNTDHCTSSGENKLPEVCSARLFSLEL